MVLSSGGYPRQLLTYYKALEIVKGMEAADKNVKAFRIPDPAIKKLRGHQQKSSDP